MKYNRTPRLRYGTVVYQLKRRAEKHLEEIRVFDWNQERNPNQAENAIERIKSATALHIYTEMLSWMDPEWETREIDIRICEYPECKMPYLPARRGHNQKYHDPACRRKHLYAIKKARQNDEGAAKCQKKSE